MKYALIPHLSPPVPRLSYAMLSSTSSVVCSKVFVPSPSVFTPSPIKSHFVGYLQLMKGENKLEKFSEASRRQIPKPRQCLKRCQEVIELADEDFQMRDRLDDNENRVYTLSDYPFEDDDTIIVPAEDMEQVGVDILQEQVHAFTMYKHVDQKIKPISTTFPEEARVRRTIPREPLLSLVPLPIRPPDFIPTARLTEERMRELNVNQDGFLWPEEEKLFKHVLALNEATLPYDEKDRGTFSQEYFSDYIMPVVSHTPWEYKNIPIPPGIRDKVIQFLRSKIEAGVYEASQSSYRSQWFCILKKNGTLRLIHDLQPLNKVSIRDAGLIPEPDEFIEPYGGCQCYTMFDMFLGI